MKLVRFFLGAFAAAAALGVFAQPVASIGAGTMTVQAFAWQSDCAAPTDNQPASCSVPRPFPEGTEATLELEVAAVSVPGQAAYRQRRVELQELNFLWSVFSVFPSESSGLPPYLQLRIELLSPVRAVCVQSVRNRTTFEAPPLICVGFAGERQVGVTLRGWSVSASAPMPAP